MTAKEHPLWANHRIVERKLVLDAFFKIYCDYLYLSEREPSYPYYSLVTPADAVVILAMTTSSEFLINQEYRYPANKVLLSLPGGYLGKEESALAGAKRELLEETGYCAETFTLIGQAFPCPGITGQKIYFVLAEGATKQQNPSLEPTEQLLTASMKMSDLKKAIIDQQVVDGNLCTALFYYHCLKS